jgi:hypothetical protein
MANMGYCRFINTVEDLQDCDAHMDDTDLSVEETQARRALIRLAVSIALQYGEDVGMPCARQ